MPYHCSVSTNRSVPPSNSFHFQHFRSFPIDILFLSFFLLLSLNCRHDRSVGWFVARSLHIKDLTSHTANQPLDKQIHCLLGHGLAYWRTVGLTDWSNNGFHYIQLVVRSMDHRRSDIESFVVFYVFIKPKLVIF